ncbi:MAG: ADP-glyceromanno-heptose 6-epimerase [Beijerinckiaceae bacterium]
MPNLSILVTGGCGFVGSNIAARLARDGHHLTICDWFGDTEKWRNIAAIPAANVILPDGLTALLANSSFDLVIHMGAISATTERDVDLIVRTNIVLSRQLLDYCTERGARFIYASSAATYGDGESGFDDDEDCLSSLKPLNAYGWSKNVFDQVVMERRKFGQALPPQWVGLKLFNVFGPREYHKGDMRSVVLKIFEQIHAKKPVTLFKSYRAGIPHGGQQRDFIYVRDVVDVIAWFIRNPAVSGIFNLGTGQARSFLDLGRAVFAALERRPKITFVAMPITIRPRYQYFTEANMGRLRQAGYVERFTSLEEGVHDYVTQYLTKDPYGGF